MADTIKLRRGTATQWATANPVLADGEPGYDETNDQIRIGNGVSAWSALSALDASAISADKLIYVSRNALASDSNNGLSVGSPMASLAAAIAALGGGPGVIQLLSGTWTLPARADLVSGLRIIGVGQNLTTIQPGPALTTTMLSAEDLSDIYIADLTLDCQSIASHGIDVKGTLVGFTNIRLVRVTVKNATTYGLKAFQASSGALTCEIDVDDCDLSDNVVAGGFFQYLSRVGIQGGRFNRNGATATGSGIVLAGCETAIVNSVEASGNGNHGVTTATPGAVNPMQYLTVSNSVCNDNGGDLAVRGSGVTLSVEAQLFAITGNVCNNNLVAGINADVAALASTDMEMTRGAITGNVCTNTRKGPGIHGNYASFVSCEGNVCMGSTGTLGHGISLNSCFGWSIGPNILANNLKYGLLIGTPVGTETISGVPTSPGTHTVAVQHYYNNVLGDISVDPGNVDVTVCLASGATGPMGPAGYGISATLLSGAYSISGIGSIGAVSSPQAIEFAIPFVPSADGTIDRLSCDVTIGGASGSVTRLGLRADTGTTQPASVLGDFGTVASTGTGRLQSATIGTPVDVTGGTLYWLTATTQGSPATAPTLRAVTGANPLVVAGVAPLSTAGVAGYSHSGVTGALGAWGSTFTTQPAVPWIWARVV